MNLMKSNLKCVLIIAFAALFAACSDDSPEPADAPAEVQSDVFYILNSGDWKANNSSLTMYNASTGESVQNYFELQNGRCLGNTANDMLVYGGKIYIAVAGEGTIEIAGVDARSLKQIECGAQPRYLAAYDGKVYATYYNGNVARIDTATLEVDAVVKVGRNPEGLAVYGGRLYVANSGGLDYNTDLGYDKSVSVIDLDTFSELKKIEVVVNPSVVVALEGGVCVVSYGDYAAVPGCMQFIDKDDNVTVVPECSNMTEVCFSHGVLYGFFSQYDADWNPTISYISYSPSSGTVESPWIKDPVLPDAPYKVCSAGEYICVTSSDYLNDGDVFMYDKEGVLVSKIPAGLNPVKIVAVE